MTRRTVLGIAPKQWADAWAGLRAIGPLMIGSGIFGLAYRALVRDVGIDPWAGLFGSVSVVAGASQIAIIESVRADAPAIVAILTAVLINARFALYSAALAPLWTVFPLRWRLALAYLMTDQAAVVSLREADEPDPVRRRWFAMGAALPFVLIYVVGTVIGLVLGPVIPEAWEVGFIVPLMFIAVLVPGLRKPAELITIAGAAVMVLLGRGWPFGLNVFIGIIAGMTAGALFETWQERRRAGDPA
ncbi:AzlC family ABC transporter permease [Demequina sp.]|uniref:AzlC family ABC transporter permease n=1 Tax=Demequina sp. TaxID=2050685 RepID=UPI003D0D6BC6